MRTPYSIPDSSRVVTTSTQDDGSARVWSLRTPGEPVVLAGSDAIPCAEYATFGSAKLALNAVSALHGDETLRGITLTHKTHYYAAAKKIKRSDIKAGNHVTVEATLDPYLKPQAVNVRVTPAL